MNFVTISSSVITKGSRILKFLRYGLKDVQTSDEVSPFGLDSSPIKGMVAIYGETSGKGETIIVGYLNKNQLAEPGEHRTFSTDDQGNVKFYTWLKKNGTMEIGGTDDNMVRYKALETAFNQLLGDHNDLVTAFNAHVHPTAATGPPSTATPGPGIPAELSDADITPAKIDQIKTL